VDIPAVADYPDKTPFHTSFDVMLEQLGMRAFTQDPTLMFDYTTPNEANDLWNKNKAVVHNFVFEALKARLEPGAPQKDDLLAGLIKSYTEDFGDMPAAEKMDHLGCNLIEMIFAGYNTVVNTLGNAVYQLSQNPAAAAAARKQIEQVMGDRILPTDADVEKLSYLQYIFYETLRLNSPVPVMARRITENIDLGNGLTLPLDAEVMFPLDAIQNDSSHWPDPEKFLPERWSKTMVPCTWMPFSEGPRRCLGQHYAKLFFNVALISFLRSFDFEAASDYKHKLMFTGFGSTPFCMNKMQPLVNMMLKPRRR